MSARQVPKLTPEEYLAADRAAEFRSEYVDGEMFAMSGGTQPHAELIASIARELGNALFDGPCRITVTELRLQLAHQRAYLYPDIMVTFQPNPEDPADMISNTAVVVEVLSPSTERWDRVGKFAMYRQMDSIREYLLVSQDEMRIEWYTRTPNNDWMYHEANGVDGRCHLRSLDITLDLGRIYKKWMLAQ